ncbi:MAG TPA: DUF2157 domain-containing protein [Polyangia bacterium]|jgi:hypothetical protein
MDLGEDDLEWAAKQGLIGAEQAAPLWRALSARAAGRAPGPSATASRFDMVHVAYYFGALIVIGAMGFFMSLGWEAFGGGGIFAIAAAYALVFVFAGRALWRKAETKIPGGLLITMAVCMTPLAMYGLERLTGIWPDSDPGRYRDFHELVRGGWIWMELETILAGLLALKFVRFPFLTAPIAFVLWYMSMDLAPLLFGANLEWSERGMVSAGVGAVMLAVGWLIDRRTDEDYAFWIYLFGLMAFSGGLASMHSGSQLMRFAFCLVHLGLIVVAVLLERRTFLIFGALGVFGYLSYLSWDVFADSVAFPFALSFLGILILFVAVKYAKNRDAVDRRLLAIVPEAVKSRLPRARARG